MGRDERDPYSVLGLGREASASEISRAYRRAARETHPDRHPGNPSAAERFNAVRDAYNTLRDPNRRATYDRAHPVARAVRPGPRGRAGRGPVWAGSIEVALGGRRKAASRVRIDQEVAELVHLFPRLFRAFRERRFEEG